MCRSCGLGLLLHAREDAAPGERNAFLVVDRSRRVQALSRRAETLLGVCEEVAVQRPIGELVVCADAEAQPFRALADAVMHANADSGGPVGVLVHCGVHVPSLWLAHRWSQRTLGRTVSR